MGQFSNSSLKHFSYLCEYAIRFDLSCSFCEYPFIFHCLHCSPSCFDPDSLLLAYLWLGLSWIDCISANKSFSSSETSSRKPYTSSKQQERHKHSVEITINFSFLLRFQKQLLGKGPKGEKGRKAGPNVSADPSLQSKGRPEQQTRGSRPPRSTTTPQEAAQQRRQRETGGGGAREKAEILPLEAESRLLREQLKAAVAARKTAQEALTGERAAWERREKGCKKQRAELQQQLSARAQARAVGRGGAESGADPNHVLYLQAAAVELHSSLSAQRHCAINMGVKEATLTELKGMLDKHPVAHLLDPRRRQAEEGEGSQGSKWSRKRAGFGARQVVSWRANS